MKQSAVMHPTQKYAWVCSFQETPSEPITSNCDQFIFDLGEERDQLRKQVKLLRDAMLKAASEIRRCDYTPARSTLLTTLAATEPK